MFLEFRFDSGVDSVYDEEETEPVCSACTSTNFVLSNSHSFMQQTYIALRVSEKLIKIFIAWQMI